MKLYTIDGALLTDRPEIRIGDKVYPVDDRKSTVEKVMQMSKEANSENLTAMDATLTLTLGADAAKEIAALDLPFPAYMRLFETVMAVITGETPEDVAQRFQDEKAKRRAVR